MKITKDTPIDVLMHGGNIDYIDLDEGEMMHWKYIKREKLPNGKWRYYYKDDEYDKLVKDYGNTIKSYELNTEYYKNLRWLVWRYTAELDKKNGGDIAATNKDKRLISLKKERDEIGDEALRDYEKLKRLKPQFEKAKKRYERSAGYNLAKFLNNSADAIDRAKDWMKNRFRR